MPASRAARATTTPQSLMSAKPFANIWNAASLPTALSRRGVTIVDTTTSWPIPAKAVASAGIDVVPPKPKTSNAKAEGQFDKADFTYIKTDEEYICPAGQRAVFRMVTEEREMMLRRYWSSACPKCPLKAQCTPSSNRRITRWEHEEMLEAVQRRLEQSPESMMIRRRTVEHVFGTLKSWMGYTHFLTRRLPNVGAEMSLNVLAYNFKRLLGILGFEAMMKAMRLAEA